MKLTEEKAIIYFLRLALGVSFLSAVADRFGLWGAPGGPNIAWGNFTNFIQYTGVVNSFLPSSFIPALAWIATLLEIILGVFLIIGFKVKESALLSGALLLAFAVAMTISGGIKGPFNYSVFSASAGGFALYLIQKNRRHI